MKRKFLSPVVLFGSFSAVSISSAQASITPPPGYCAVQCNGQKPPGKKFDYKGNISSKGLDPSGSPKAPVEEGGTATEQVDPGQFASQMSAAEDFVNKECGTSLADDSVNTYTLFEPCNTPLVYRNSVNSVNGAHQPSGVVPPGLPGMDAFFQAAKSAENKEALKSKKFIFRQPTLKPCEGDKWDIGTTETLYLGMALQSCRGLVVPAVPGKPYTGMPAGSLTNSKTEAGLKAFMLNKNFSPFYVETSLTSPAQGNVSTVANIVMKGKTVYTVPAILASAPEAKIDESRSDALFNWEDSVTFAVGPIPLTVEFGANGKAGASVNLRNSNMWSNGRGVPFADLNGFANAAVDLWIAKAGIEAQIKFVALALDNYAFSGALYNGAEK